MGAAYGSDILYSESVEPENRVYNMEKIWEVILILVLAGMGFILQLDRKKENGTEDVRCFFEKTEVVFYPMTEEEIDQYVATGEPMDKAGSYGIQGVGGLYVREIHGDYNNVVGLPIARLYHELKK